MPLYDFECEPCAYHTEIRQGMHESGVHECPLCGQQTLKKIFINAPNIFVRGEPTTIGQMADKNTRNMGKMELQAKEQKDSKKKKMTAEQKKKRSEHQSIISMTPEQQTHWIKTGEKPS